MLPSRPSARRPRRSARRGGFTLVEVMVASLVLLTVFFAGLSALRTGFDLLDTARNSTLASQIMQSELEDIRLKNWARMPVTGDITLPADLTSGDVKFTAHRKVEDLATHGNTMKKVTITVNWTTYNGRKHTRTYETRFSKNGINDYFVTSRE